MAKVQMHPTPPRHGAREKRVRGKGFYRLRDAQLKREPLCRRCADQGHSRLATVADHIVPLARGGAERDPSNLRSLCRPCHLIVTAEQFDRAPPDPIRWPNW